MKRVGKKLGDTLVEVTIAIGIFSLVAVAIVAVVSGSMSGSQAALENTVAREEIDAQAEALRFIQKNAMTDIGQSGEGSEVWNEIVKNHTISTDHSSNPYKYDINQCSSLYNGTLSSQKAFVINTRMLSTGDASKIVQSYNSTFKTASTYPRIIYSDDNSLIDQDSANTISAVEGIFIIAVKDDKDTKIVDGGTVKNKSAYYDFYIRTCWYAAGSNAPTTISTVVRLYNPDVATEGITPSYNDDGPYDHFIYHVSNQANSDGTNLKYFELDERLRVKTGLSAQFNTHTSYAPTGFNFTDKKMWCWQKPTKADGTCPGGNYYNAGDTYTAGTGYTRDNQGIGGQPRHLYAVYNPNPMVSLNYNNNGGSGTMQRDTVRAGQSVKVKENKFTRNGYKFKGWNTEKNGKGTSYKVGKEFNLEADLTLYAQWEKNPDTIYFDCGDGSVNNSNNTTQNFTSNGYLRAYSEICNLPSDNHSFSSWSIIEGKPNSSTSSYADKASYKYVGGKTVKLKAQYSVNCSFTSQTFNYTGSVQSWKVPCTATYTFKVCGAQGGSASSDDIGGKGGCATGKKQINANTTLYITIGGAGGAALGRSSGGYNGGGNGTAWAGGWSGGGGGATHISTVSGLLKENTVRNGIIIAAGGGGGSVSWPAYQYTAGAGGGGNGEGNTLGYDGCSGATTSATSTGCNPNGSSGQGGSNDAEQNTYAGGGGGGWFGGGAAYFGGSGGSGYTTGLSNVKVESGVQSNNGYAIITRE